MKHNFLLLLAAAIIFCGCETKNETERINQAIEDQVVNFDYQISGLTVTFHDHYFTGVNGGIASRVWIFGDGTYADNGTRQDIFPCSMNAPYCCAQCVHTYAASGTYDVTLQIKWYDTGGTEPIILSKTCTKAITVAKIAKIRGVTLHSVADLGKFYKISITAKNADGETDLINAETAWDLISISDDLPLFFSFNPVISVGTPTTLQNVGDFTVRVYSSNLPTGDDAILCMEDTKPFSYDETTDEVLFHTEDGFTSVSLNVFYE